MKQKIALTIFTCLLILASAFILLTSPLLPDSVATQFGWEGTAHYSISLWSYLLIMLSIAVLLPATIVLLTTKLFNKLSHAINIPNKVYWLSEENKDATITFLSIHMVWFGSILTIFVSFIHLLILQAHALQPPQLSNGGLILGTSIYLIFTFIWMIRLLVKFLRIPKK